MFWLCYTVIALLLMLSFIPLFSYFFFFLCLSGFSFLPFEKKEDLCLLLFGFFYKKQKLKKLVDLNIYVNIFLFAFMITSGFKYLC